MSSHPADIWKWSPTRTEAHTHPSFVNAIKDQPALAILSSDAVKAAAVVLFLVGQVFVLSSMWALGVTGACSLFCLLSTPVPRKPLSLPA